MGSHLLPVRIVEAYAVLSTDSSMWERTNGFAFNHSLHLLPDVVGDDEYCCSCLETGQTVTERARERHDYLDMILAKSKIRFLQ
jgi:hypothetical protein